MSDAVRILIDQVARLFGPAIFEASKLKVMFLGVDEKKHPEKLPRTYTLTHSDITSNLTLGISHSINDSQVIHNKPSAPVLYSHVLDLLVFGQLLALPTLSQVSNQEEEKKQVISFYRYNYPRCK